MIQLYGGPGQHHLWRGEVAAVPQGEGVGALLFPPGPNWLRLIGSAHAGRKYASRAGVTETTDF